jgi:ceramide glucosyltransferase
MTLWIVVRDALLLLALAPSAYYLLAIIAAARFFSGRPKISSADGRQITPNSSAAGSEENSPARNGWVGQEKEASAGGAAQEFSPGISVLKPIRGLDRETYENYASFCAQDYPEFEILFCVSDDQDAAIPVIRRIIADFPQRSIRLLVGSEYVGASDKVNKLCRMAREARYDVLLVSDSDVRVEQGFLRAVVAPLADPNVGGVTCLYKGATDGSFAADLEALGNSADFSPGVLSAWMLAGRKLNFMLGAVMITTKQNLSAIGGFESIADYFCDDYELGNRLAASGKPVALSTATVSIVYPSTTLAAAFRHQVRWNLSIRYSRPLSHFGLIFSQGIFWTVLAVCLAPANWMAYAYVVAYGLLRTDAALSVGARGMGDQLVRRKGWMLPLRDAFAFLVWLASFVPQSIQWRDKKFVVRDKKLIALP